MIYSALSWASLSLSGIFAPKFYPIREDDSLEKLKKLVSQVAREKNFTKDIRVKTHSGWPFSTSAGNMLLEGQVGISLDKDLILAEEGVKRFFIQHEMIRIQSNDFLLQGLAASLSSLLSSMALGAFSLSPVGVGFIGGAAGWAFFSRWCEKRADQAAFKCYSDKDQLDIIDFLEEKQCRYSYERKKNKLDGPFFKSILTDLFISQEGDVRVDFLRNSLTSRIKNLKDLHEKGKITLRNIMENPETEEALDLTAIEREVLSAMRRRTLNASSNNF